jgi:hypothetical protein
MHCPPTALAMASLHQLRLMWQWGIADKAREVLPTDHVVLASPISVRTRDAEVGFQFDVDSF